MRPQGFSLDVERLAIGWQQKALAQDIAFRVPAGGSLAVIGESGCGKSTLLQTLAGLLNPISGTVNFIGSADTKPKKAMVWQSLALFPWMRVKDNLALPLWLEHLSGEEIRRRVQDMLEELELDGLAERFPKELSGGQSQRLALGRALIAEPDVLFMDEPFSAIDAVLREHLQIFLKSLWQRHGCTMIFVTHDISEALYLGESIVMLGARPSRMVACGTNPVFETDPHVDVRNSESFYAAHRRLHEAFVRVRQGESVELSGGAW